MVVNNCLSQSHFDYLFINKGVLHSDEFYQTALN